ncbi:MAG: aspartate-semialdehyde dehydrogenase [Candidatus Dormibacteraeota bacterium]|nr:aspartate-semialdehyde dehydrogenase [Candidatus Dormibacteraeota bacterium]
MSTSNQGLSVAVVGATGMVGQEMFRVLAQRKFPVAKLKALASDRSTGMTVRSNGHAVEVETLNDDSFRDVDLALFSAGADVSLMYAPLAVESGALVVDNSSAWRMKENVPLVVPEVNPDDIRESEGIIANPNCCTIPLTVVLEPLRREAGVERVLVSTYQSASGAGKKLVDELEDQVRALATGRTPEATVYSHQLAYNVVPGEWTPDQEGYNEEEIKLVNESRKILHDPGLRIAATCVRVPVPVGHGESVFVELGRMVSADDIRTILGDAPGVLVEDDPAARIYPTPASVAGKDEVYVGRIRNDLSSSHGIVFWIVSDNLRKGAALNAVQIAERALEMGVL